MEPGRPHAEPARDVARLAASRFRAGSGYELVLFDRLPPHEQAALAEWTADPDFYGVLRPRPGSDHTIKGVNKDVALLWWSLQDPAPLPFFVWRGDEAAAQRAVVDLVLDGVLEIERDGAFVSGPAAAGLFLPAATAPRGRLARLSLDALRYGEALGSEDPVQLAGRLYAFHRQPLTPAWARRLPDGDSVLEFVGARSGTPLRRRLDDGWRRATDGAARGWVAWAPRAGAAQRAPRSYKLYLSPRIENLPEVFARLVDLLGERGGRPFKVGAEAAGLLRPDKLVVYFGDLEELFAVASECAARLTGAEAHGVPFSAEIAGDGLLSWGMDPPQSERRLVWHEQASWRLWVVRRLASFLIGARGAPPSEMTAAQFALERLRREGVDVDRWTPSAGIWRAA